MGVKSKNKKRYYLRWENFQIFHNVSQKKIFRGGDRGMCPYRKKRRKKKISQ